MAKITTAGDRDFATREDADAFIRNLDGRVLFLVHINAWLPEAGTTAGYRAGSCLAVSRQQFREVVRESAANAYLERGAQIRLKVSLPMYDRGPACVSLAAA